MIVRDHPVARIEAVIDECLPLLRALAIGRYAVTIGGSHGKGTFDERSDVDFRVFCDEVVGAPEHWKTQEWKDFSRVVDRWRAEGIDVDYCWFRTVNEIDAKLKGWLSGDISPEPMVWTLWGYHLLTDIANQMIIEDPDGIVAAWQAQLTPYPSTLKQAIIRKHTSSLNYWRTDYHYANKVARGDEVFLAGMASRLVHDMMQVLFAINEVYYVGDGNNLHYVASFPIQPSRFPERVNEILYPRHTENVFVVQYEDILALIDDVVTLANQVDTTASSPGALTSGAAPL